MSGAKIVALARGIASALTGCDTYAAVYSLPNPSPEVFSASVIPSAAARQGFGKSPVAFDVQLLAAVTDVEASVEWLLDQPDVIEAALAADRTCGGTCSGVTVTGWSDVQLVTIGSGDALSLRVTLSPTYAKG